MQIICISRGSYEYGNDVAEKLSRKTGYAAISRETITDKATEFGIPIGKSEMMVVNNRPLTEEMSNVVDKFKAFVTSYICERAQNESVIYHGRTGHLVLPGLSNVLRVRAIADQEYRIKQVMVRLNLDREKSKKYIEQVDEDRRRWSHTLYNANWDDPSLYDVTINAAHLSAENAASALTHFAQLPEFQATPSSKQTLQDLLLSVHCRLAIGSDERTRNVKAGIHVEKGNVSVTYMPRQSMEAKAVPEVLESMDGVKSLICTVATTNILCIGERFEPDAEYLGSLIEISKKWNAAIEIIRLAGEDEKSGDESSIPSKADAVVTNGKNGGILEDSDIHAVYSNDQDHGVYDTMDKLIQVGHAGGSRTIYGQTDGLLDAIPKTEQYSLIAVGDVFLSKGAARQRLKREMISELKDKFHIPVVGAEDLKSRYLFGLEQFLSLIGFAVLSALIYFGLFAFEEPIVTFVSKGHFGGGFHQKAAASFAVVVCIPIVAYIIGGFYSNLLKLLKIE
jgi:cytidylate kinase